MSSVGKTITNFNKKVNTYFNPIGQLYTKYVISFRIIVVNVFLKDLFSKDGLTCETKQVGCQLSCINRFAPINHMQIWNFELFCIALSITFFLCINLLNQHQFEKTKRKLTNQLKNDQLVSLKISENTSFRYKHSILHSNYTVIGYIGMLSIRLALECWCLFIEMNLARNHSQNSGFMESLSLKERWLCPTYGEVHEGDLASGIGLGIISRVSLSKLEKNGGMRGGETRS